MTSCRVEQTHELVGESGTPVILVLGGISATRHVSSAGGAQGWWADIARPGGALNPNFFQLLSVDYLDSPPESAKPHRPLTMHDQAKAILALLNELEIDRLHAVIGASYGGMVALALAELCSERVERLVVMSAAHRSSVMATAHRAIQRQIVALGRQAGSGERGMTIARALAMTTYRTGDEFETRFSLTPDFSETAPFDVERYLMHAGAKFARAMSPERFLALSLSADLHDVAPERILVPSTVIAAEGDALIPAALTEELFARLGRPLAYNVIASNAGHDAFLTEPDQVNALLTAAIAEHAHVN